MRSGGKKCRRRFQAMSEARLRGIAEKSTFSSCDQDVSHTCCNITPADTSPYLLVSTSCRSLELLSQPLDKISLPDGAFWSPKTNTPPPHTGTAILPFLPADDGRCERSTPLTNHREGGAQFRGLRMLICGMWASRL